MTVFLDGLTLRARDHLDEKFSRSFREHGFGQAEIDGFDLSAQRPADDPVCGPVLLEVEILQREFDALRERLKDASDRASSLNCAWWVRRRERERDREAIGRDRVAPA